MKTYVYIQRIYLHFSYLEDISAPQIKVKMAPNQHFFVGEGHSHLFEDDFNSLGKIEIDVSGLVEVRIGNPVPLSELLAFWLFMFYETSHSSYIHH